MKSLVLFLFLLVIVLSLAQVSKHNNGRWLQWFPPPLHNVQVCHSRGFPPNAWPKVAMHHMILPAPSSGNIRWRNNQDVDWPPPFQSFFFGFPNFFSPWVFQPQYQSGILPRYPRRLPTPMPLQFGAIQGQWPMQPHMGPTHGQWPGQIPPINRQWPMYPRIGPTHGPWAGQMGPTNRQWPMYPHIGPKHSPWPGKMGPINRQWPMYPHIGPAHGPWPGQMRPTNRQWPLYPHMVPHMPPYYLGVRNHYYIK